MKNRDRDTITELESLPNIGKAMASYLRLIGIDEPKKLIGKDPFKMYDQLCEKQGKQIDPCALDIFISIVNFMEGGEAQPWWMFTKKRKEILSK